MASVRAYKLTPKGEKALGESKGQQKLIVDHMKLANTVQSVAQIAEGIVANLQTRQDPQRVVAFYMSVWKKKGLIAMSENEVPEGSAAEQEGEDAADENGDDEDNEDEGEGDQDASAVETPGHPSSVVETATSALDGMSISEAVLWSIKKDGPQTIDQITRTLAFESYHSPATGMLVGAGTVKDALQNLIRRGEVKKDTEGLFARRH